MASKGADVLSVIHNGLQWRKRAIVNRLRPWVGVTDQQWARVQMDRVTAQFVGRLDPGKLDALEVSGSKWESVGFKSYRGVTFPSFDLCALPLSDAAFDIVIAEQVLEHVLWPYRAVRNAHAMLRPGGWFVVTTPFLLRVHPSPHDCSRWTEDGLRYLLAEGGFGLNDIQTGSWGNRACIRANFAKWAMWVPWLHSLRNESDFPVVVWAFAQKRVAAETAPRSDMSRL